MLRIASQLIAQERAAAAAQAAAAHRAQGMTTRRLKLLSANIQAGSSTRRYSDYVARSWSHVLPAGNKRGASTRSRSSPAATTSSACRKAIRAACARGSPTRPITSPQRGGFAYWSHQPNRSVGGVASSANGLLSKLEPVEVIDHPLPGRIAAAACCWRGSATATTG